MDLAIPSAPNAGTDAKSRQSTLHPGPPHFSNPSRDLVISLDWMIGGEGSGVGGGDAAACALRAITSATAAADNDCKADLELAPKSDQALSTGQS